MRVRPKWVAMAAVLSAGCAETTLPSPHAALVAEDGAPIVGRVQLRDRKLDLTRTSVSAGGAAHDLARGTAKLMADIEPPAPRERR